MLKRRQQGDTIIEVLFAITIFSLVAVGAMSIMNQGLAMAQRALEISLVRQQMDAQADALRFLNQAYISDFGKRGAPTKIWQQVITASAVERAQDFSDMVADSRCRLPSVGEQPFALDITKLDGSPRLTPAANPATYAKVRYDSSPAVAEGIWVQAVRSPLSADGKPGFYDFHIRACWYTLGQSRPLTLGTIVRQGFYYC